MNNLKKKKSLLKSCFSGAMDSAINKATSAFAKIGGDQVILAHIIVLTLKIW